MEKIIGALVFAITICSCANSGMAQVAETAPATNYPDPQCTKPDIKIVKPMAPKSVYDWGPVNAYNDKIKAYNRDLKAYDSCMHAYIDKANSDVKRIQDQANADLKRITGNANTAIKVVEDKIRQAVGDANDVAVGQAKSTASLRGP